MLSNQLADHIPIGSRQRCDLPSAREDIASTEHAPGREYWRSILQEAGGNQFASGGLTLIAAGAALSATRYLLERVYQLVKKSILLTAEFESKDDSYRWIILWLSENALFQDGRNYSVSANLRHFGSQASGAGEGPDEPQVFYVPLGARLLQYKGTWMLVTREKTEPTAGLSFIPEKVTLHMVTASRKPLEELVNEARARFLEVEKKRTAIYTHDAYGFWERTALRPIRPFDSVVLDDGVSQHLLNDCRQFLQSEEWYVRQGIPYRRGYLLHGPPGTGKTSFVTALAGALKLNIYVVSLSTPDLSDDILAQMLSRAAQRCILLFEDVDSAFIHRSTGEVQASALSFSGALMVHGAGVSISGLLNAIDGVAAQEGRLLFLTTNHPERISSALLRPGRVDVKVKLDRCTSFQVSAAVLRAVWTDLIGPYFLLQAGGSSLRTSLGVQGCHREGRGAPVYGDGASFSLQFQ
ncbi:hypothetical protein CYMTET_37793 [Cymbomonas tetramitiformis]|uniref:Mitochondrial chaperone BCS1 n=1 Tax=Cymbomonas tetramitiformis TaxID=36881 RepID=A0AAE0F791_9CHLO|nr:hypothetical protein CYMTET_37793 [Cymbomonas tetramitiformis]